MLTSSTQYAIIYMNRRDQPSHILSVCKDFNATPLKNCLSRIDTLREQEPGDVGVESVNKNKCNTLVKQNTNNTLKNTHQDLMVPNQ